MSFKTQIEDLVGSIPATADVDQFMNDGVWDIVLRLKQLSPELLPLFTSEQDITDGNGLAIEDIVLTSAALNGKECERISAKRRFDAVDSDSLYYIDSDYPAFYIHDHKVYILPAPTVPIPGTVSVVASADIDSDTSAISNVPESFYRLVVIYAALKVIQHNMTLETTPDDITFPDTPTMSPTVLVTESLPTFTAPEGINEIVSPANSLIEYDDTDIPVFNQALKPVLPTLDIEAYTLAFPSNIISSAPDVPSAPSFSDGNTILPSDSLAYVAPSISLPSVPTITDLTISAVAPSAPADPSYAEDIDALGSAPTYAAPTKPVLPVLDIEAYSLSLPAISVEERTDLAYPSFPGSDVDLPTDSLVYTAPTISLPETPSISDLTISSTAPVTPDSPDYVEEIDALGDAPIYIAPTMSLEAKQSLSALTVSPDALVVPDAPSISYVDAIVGSIAATTIVSPGSTPTFTPPSVVIKPAPTITNLSLSTTAIEALPSVVDLSSDEIDFTDVDTKQPAYIAPALDLYSRPSLVSFGAMPAVPSSVSAPSISVSDITASTISDVTLVDPVAVVPYTEPVSGVSFTEAESYIRTYEDIELGQAELSKVEGEIRDYQQSQYNELNRVNSDIEIYRSTLQANVETARLASQDAIREAELEQDADKTNQAIGLQADVKDYELSVQKVMADISLYQAEVNKIIAEYTAQNNIIIQEWHQANSSAIQKYSVDVQSALNSFNEQVVVYNAYLQKAIKDAEMYDATSELRANLGRAQVGVQRYSASVNAEVQEWKVNAEKDISIWREENASLLSEYSANIQNQLAEFNSNMSAYNAVLQENIEQARITLQENTQTAAMTSDVNKANELNTLNAAISDYQSVLQRFGLDVQRYREEVNKAISEWQAENALDVQNWQTYNTTLLQKYANDIQSSTISFNESVVYFQADLQRKIANAQNKGTLEAKEQSDLLQAYSSEIVVYQTNVNKEVQEWMANTNREIELWKQETQAAISVYSNDIQNALNAYNKTAVRYQSSVQKALQDAQVSQRKDIEEYSATLRNYELKLQDEIVDKNNAISVYLNSTIQEYIIEYNTRTANAVQKHQIDSNSILQKYSADIQNSTNMFNEEMVYFQADLQRKIANAQNKGSLEAQEQGNLLQAYSIEVAVYQNNINKEVQAWTANTNKDIELWKQETQATLSEYSLNVQNALNSFNKTAARYQSEVQKALQDAQLSQKTDTEEYAAELQRFSLELQEWMAYTNSSIQVYLNSTIQREIIEYNVRTTNAMQKYQTDISASLQDYSLNIQDSVQEWQADFSKWSTINERIIRKYQAENNVFLTDFSNRAKQEFDMWQTRMSVSQADFQEEVKAYELALQTAMHENQISLGKFSAEIQNYSVLLQGRIQDYNSKLQASQIEYGRRLQEYNILKSEYESGFALYMKGDING